MIKMKKIRKFLCKLKHNCTKEGDFEFVEIDPMGSLPDRIRCLKCGRTWVEENKK